jgi:hypothetical protein
MRTWNASVIGTTATTGEAVTARKQTLPATATDAKRVVVSSNNDADALLMKSDEDSRLRLRLPGKEAAVNEIKQTGSCSLPWCDRRQMMMIEDSHLEKCQDRFEKI